MIAIRDFFGKVYNKLYCFLSYTDTLFPWFFTVSGISLTTLVLENLNMMSSILRTKTHTKNPQFLTLIFHY